MTYPGSSTPPDDDPVGPIVELFLEQYRRGQRPALSALVARHPELAAQIRERIPALVELEQLGHSAASIDPDSGRLGDDDQTGNENMSPDRLGDYRLLRRLRGGGMGVVYEAEHESLKSRVALKVMHPRFRADPKYLRRFQVEARLAAGLHHTNIVTVFDYGAQDGVCYYAMQFIQGQPLDRILADIRRLQDDDTNAETDGARAGIVTMPAAVGSAAVQGLRTGRFASTTESITIPPSTGDGPQADFARGCEEPESLGFAVKLTGPGARAGQRSHPADAPSDEPGRLDYSSSGATSLGGSGELRYYREIAQRRGPGGRCARIRPQSRRDASRHQAVKLASRRDGQRLGDRFRTCQARGDADASQSRELVGTLRYMAPERFRGTSDRRGDVYSLGATLYELLTLRPCFDETDHLRLIERIRDDAPPPPRQIDRKIPRNLETIVLKALSAWGR